MTPQDHRLRIMGCTVRWVMMTSGVVASLAGLSGCQKPHRAALREGPEDGAIRAIWVTRWDYKSPAEIARVMKNCRQAGFNTVLFQVRGNGTAFYRSRIEPWADELGGRDPGFDPLAVACKEAHRRGLSLHAWVNVIPGWRGKQPPTNPRQLYHAHSDWFWRDARGRRQPLGWYNSLNPGYPEVRRYLVAVMREIVSRYPVDGLHLDYIRYPAINALRAPVCHEWNNSYPRGARVPDYPRDPRTLALFKQATGRTPDRAPEAWNQWRTDQITQVVRDIRAAVQAVRPRAMLSAAVGAHPEEAKRKHFQDVRQWMAEGLLDAVYPMNYAEDMPTYAGRLTAWSAMRPGIPVVTGIMFDKRSSATVLAQVRRARRSGKHFAAFAYNSLFERLDRKRRPAMDEQSASRAALRQQVIPEVRRRAPSRA